jgi:hypothetical protein
MAEATEIPEANDPFEKQVAITIAILAIVMSFVSMKGDNAKTESILKTNEATNAWGYYQAKSIKQTIADNQADLMDILAVNTPSKAVELKAKNVFLKNESGRYDKEKSQIKKKADELAKESEHDSAINDRCDLGALFLQLAVVVASVSILTHIRAFWLASLLVGACGAVIGLSAFWL